MFNRWAKGSMAWVAIAPALVRTMNVLVSRDLTCAQSQESRR